MEVFHASPPLFLLYHRDDVSDDALSVTQHQSLNVGYAAAPLLPIVPARKKDHVPEECDVRSVLAPHTHLDPTFLLSPAVEHEHR